MSPIIPIWSKELKDYFVSPIAYMVIAIFLLVTGWFFFSTFFIRNQASMRYFFNLLPITFSFVVPALTMRLFAEEFHVGSFEMLITMPVRVLDVVLGKFLAGLSVIAAMLVPTLAYPAIIAFLGKLDWGPVLGGYIGAIFLGSGFTAVGLFASALTRNQIVAFILGTLICFALALVDQMLFFVPAPLLDFIQYLGAAQHFGNVAKGVLDSRDLLYFLSLTFLGLYLTHMMIQARQ
jgi:ABC-2 type transport system permease protein